MSDPYVDKVREFMDRLYGPDRSVVQLDDTPVTLLRLRLMTEELGELAAAMHNRDRVGTADALADLLYVTFGTALAFGIPIAEVFAAVHAANMTKDFSTPGRPDQKYPGGGKGPGFRPPSLMSLLRRSE